jgi:hypothetical protein
VVVVDPVLVAWRDAGKLVHSVQESQCGKWSRSATAFIAPQFLKGNSLCLDQP